MKQLSFLTVLVLLSACANIGTLGGGPVDSKAPILLDSNITKTGFNSNSIKLTFDEYIAANQANENILLFPKHSSLKTSVSNKTVTIKFDSALKPNTTYQLMINGGIVDVNANNPYKNTFTFSTGSIIDTGKLHIQINNFDQYKPLKLALTEAMEFDDSFKLFQTSYVLPLNQNKIDLNGINPNKRYSVVVFTDKDQNNKPDAYKPIGFKKNCIVDSLHTLSITKWNEPLSIKQSKVDTSKHLIWLYTNPQAISDSIEHYCSSSNYDLIVFGVDSSLVQYKNSYDLKPNVFLNLNINSLIKQQFRKHLLIYKNDQMYGLKSQLPLGFYTKEHLLNKQIKWFKTKPDTIHLNNDFLKFNDTLLIGACQVIETNRLAHLKVTIHNPNSKIYKVEFSVNQQILKIVNNTTDINSYLHSGKIESQIIEDYFPAGTIEIKVISNDLIEPKKLNFKNGIIYQKSLGLKAGWDEETLINLE